MTAIQLFKLGCTLGEGSMWHQARKSFFWVDIEQKKFYECHWLDKRLNTYELNYRVSLVLETSQPGIVLLGAQGGLMKYNLDTRQHQWVTEIEHNIPTNRTNDGACDATGRIWIGTMDVDCRDGKGALYQLAVNGAPELVVDDMSIPNGIVWSADGTTMYHVESQENEVRAYDFDVTTGEISFDRIAIQVPKDLGSPDGMCMDEQGMLWIAQWGGFGVYRWDPVSGKLISKIDVPVPQVSNCVFGGDDMKTLLITTARQGMPADEIEKYPESGDVFVASTDFRGAPRFIANGW